MIDRRSGPRTLRQALIASYPIACLQKGFVCSSDAVANPAARLSNPFGGPHS